VCSPSSPGPSASSLLEQRRAQWTLLLRPVAPARRTGRSPRRKWSAVRQLPGRRRAAARPPKDVRHFELSHVPRCSFARLRVAGAGAILSVGPGRPGRRGHRGSPTCLGRVGPHLVVNRPTSTIRYTRAGSCRAGAMRGSGWGLGGSAVRRRGITEAGPSNTCLWPTPLLCGRLPRRALLPNSHRERGGRVPCGVPSDGDERVLAGGELVCVPVDEVRRACLRSDKGTVHVEAHLRDA
jgi:hypothetical protein